MGLVVADPRTTSAYRKLSAAYKAECRQRRRLCCHCAQAIDYTLTDTNDPHAFTVEHTHPVSTHPHLVNDTTHWQPAHRACNSSRGVGDMKPSLGKTTREW